MLDEIVVFNYILMIISLMIIVFIAFCFRYYFVRVKIEKLYSPTNSPSAFFAKCHAPKRQSCLVFSACTLLSS